jgi:hypothetical protein
MEKNNLANLADVVRIITKEQVGAPITVLHCRAALDTLAAAKHFMTQAVPLLVEYERIQKLYEQGCPDKRFKLDYPSWTHVFEENVAALEDAKKLLVYEPVMPELKRRIFELQRTPNATQIRRDEKSSE